MLKPTTRANTITQSEAEGEHLLNAVTEINLYEIIAAIQRKVKFLKNKQKEFEDERKDASAEIKILKDKQTE